MTAPTELPTEINVPVDVPDADAVEQARQMLPDDLPQPTHVHDGSAVDEYDAVEQAIEVEEDEEAYRE